jgi:O-methyltransferase involved in polyketide biosynthesis
MNKIKLSQLPHVARTLLVPLAARAVESKRANPILNDPLDEG